ncbi:MAG: four helix bundle protein [Dehalococcoidia bacterium]
MARSERFEDIAAWQKARELTREVYLATGSEAFRGEPLVRDQLRRACLEIVSDIADGSERADSDEFRLLLTPARGSAGEVRALLSVAYDIGLLDERQFTRLHALATETTQTISGFMRYLESSEHKGGKLK